MVFHINFTPLKIKTNKSSLMIPKSTFYPLQDGIFSKHLLEKKSRSFEVTKFQCNDRENLQKKHPV